MGDLKYGEFEFPSDRGFSGSAGKSEVKGYMRGGKVKATNNASGKKAYANAKKQPMTAAAKGGHMKHGKHVGGPNPSAEYPKSQARQKMPKNVKARGGTVGVTTEKGPTSRRVKSTMTAAKKGGSVHDKLMDHGKRMGYAQGGYAKAKDTSAEFDMKSKPMDSMDSGTYPPQSSNQAEKEAGGRKRTKPKFMKGGKVRKGKRNPDHTKGKGMSKKGVPKTVKARGGLAEYAEGGRVDPKDVPGTGGARRAADLIRERENRVRATADEARKSQNRGQASQRPKPKTHDKPPTKKPPRKIYREDDNGVPTFTDVPKYAGTRRMSGGRVHRR